MHCPLRSSWLGLGGKKGRARSRTPRAQHQSGISGCDGWTVIRPCACATHLISSFLVPRLSMCLPVALSLARAGQVYTAGAPRLLPCSHLNTGPLTEVPHLSTHYRCATSPHASPLAIPLASPSRLLLLSAPPSGSAVTSAASRPLRGWARRGAGWWSCLRTRRLRRRHRA